MSESAQAPQARCADEFGSTRRVFPVPRATRPAFPRAASAGGAPVRRPRLRRGLRSDESASERFGPGTPRRRELPVSVVRLERDLARP
jgi:hypothetical protein